VTEAPSPPLSRDDLVALVSRAHHGSSTEQSVLAGRALAAQSQLPTRVAENLGAGFGQWDFFPDVADIVDFALAYARPSTEEDLWSLARAWASDEAAGRHTLMALVGREMLHHELRRIAIPPLQELIDEARPSRARELRVGLGLAVPALPQAPAKAAATRSKPAAPARAPASTPDGASPVSPGRDQPKKAVQAEPRATKMPKPEFKRPEKAAAPAVAKRFQHPKFGVGVLESQDGVGPDAKLTIKFESGSKTLLARYVTGE
jgi:hypothetical protein